ncbi:MAG: hypothetical protein AB7T37_18775 [Dehalococcoidia bacterium]
MQRATPGPIAATTLLRFALLATLAALGLTGCGGGDGDSSAGASAFPVLSPTTSPAQSTPGQVASPAPMSTASPFPSAPVASATPPSTANPVPSAAVPSTAPDGTPPAGGEAGAAGRTAADTLARWLGPVGDRDAISVAAVEAVTWPDGCLGLRRSGALCTLGLVEGFRVRLALGDAEYEVRTNAARTEALWAPPVQVLARFSEASTNFVQFITDDGGLLAAQPVPGSSFGLDISVLKPGDQVAVGLAERPQGEGFLLVWLDPVSR